MQDSTIQTLLTGVLDACASRPSPRQLFHLVDIIDEFTTAATAQGALRDKVLRALSSNYLLEKCWSLAHIDVKNEGTGCCTYVDSLHRQLVAATIASLLIIAFAADPSQPTLPNALVVALVKK